MLSLYKLWICFDEYNVGSCVQHELYRERKAGAQRSLRAAYQITVLIFYSSLSDDSWPLFFKVDFMKSKFFERISFLNLTMQIKNLLQRNCTDIHPWI